MNKIVFFLILQSSIFFGQNHTKSSFYKNYNQYQYFMEKIQPDSALSYAQKCEKIAEINKEKKHLTQSYIAITSALMKIGKKSKSEIYAKKADSIVNITKDINQLLEVKLLLGSISYSNFEDAKAIKYYLEIEEIATKNKIENKTVVKTYLEMGLMILRGLEESTEIYKIKSADYYFHKSYEISKRNNLMNEFHVAGSYIGSIHVDKGEYDKALKYYDAASNYFKKNKNLDELFQINWAYASLYGFWKKNEIAEKYYNENVTIATQFYNLNKIARAHWAYAGYHVRNKNFKKAVIEYEKAITFFKKESNIDVGPYSGSLYELSKAYKQLADYKKAYITFDDFYKCKDSLLRIQNKEAYADIETKYKSEKKEQEIKLLSELNQKQRYIYLGLLSFLLCIIGSIFYSYRNKIKTARKIQELDELKSRFFANISHEFRTPLTLIKSPVQSLQEEITDANQINKLKLIDSNSNRMLELVDQLLELSKIDSGKLQLLLKEGNIATFLNTLTESFAFNAKENNRTFISNVEKETDNHYFDKDVIEKIVSNLLSNAIKYTSEKEKISFESKIIDNELKIIVSNSGTEINKEELSKLFERFYQKENNKQGVGIGLALVKELVELYNGKIDAKIENKVLSFIVILPLEKTKENTIISKSDKSKNEIINDIDNENEFPILLLVDDNDDIRNVLKNIFKDNYQIIEAINGQEAIKIAQKEIPDCIISDIMMPKMDGFEFTNKIKNNELTSFIPVILLTAKTTEEAHLEALKSEADAFLTKPFNNNIVKQTVKQILNERKKLQERYSQELILKPVDIVINSYDEKFLTKIQEVLNVQIPNSDFTADNFANEMGMSKMQLYRKLKSLVGLSANEFIRTERLKTAAELLKKSNANVSEIAYSVGFNDMSYFAKCFKETFNCTPSEYTEKF